MHASGPHGGQRLDGLRELAFQAALVVDLFLELGSAEFLVVDQLEADDAALGHPLRREAQPRVVDLCAGDQDRAAAFGNAIGNVHLVERSDDRASVPVREVAVQHTVVGGLRPDPGAYADGDQCRAAYHQRKDLPWRQAREAAQKR